MKDGEARNKMSATSSSVQRWLRTFSRVAASAGGKAADSTTEHRSRSSIDNTRMYAAMMQDESRLDKFTESLVRLDAW